MTNNLNLNQVTVYEIEALTPEQLKVVRRNIQSKDSGDVETREAVAQYVADGGQIADLLEG